MKRLFVILLGACSLGAQAQQWLPPHELVHEAIDAQPDVVAARARVDAARAHAGALAAGPHEFQLDAVAQRRSTDELGGRQRFSESEFTLSRAFRLPETSLGIVPAQIAPFLVERLGYAEAKRLSVTGAKVDAQEALTIRLVHEVHADEASLSDALQRTLSRILACGPKAITETKLLLARARHTSAEYLIDDAAAVFARAVLSEEGQEGTSAFMQKRAPSWAPPACRRARWWAGSATGRSRTR